ncbi:unnamed protein product [Schistosoma curassoni]|nr:unnamed protein product [Schistosoma curassoni]
MYWMYIILLFITALFNINKQIEAGTISLRIPLLANAELCLRYSGKANSTGSPTIPTKSGENNSIEVKPPAGGPSNEKDGDRSPSSMDPSTNPPGFSRQITPDGEYPTFSC